MMTDSDSDASFLGDAEDLYMDLDFEEDAPDLEQEAKLKPTPEETSDTEDPALAEEMRQLARLRQKHRAAQRRKPPSICLSVGAGNVTRRTPSDPLPVYLQESNDSAPSKRKTFGEPTPKVSSAEIKRRRMAMPFTDKIGESRLENKAVEAIAELVKSKKWSTPAPVLDPRMIPSKAPILKQRERAEDKPDLEFYSNIALSTGSRQISCDVLHRYLQNRRHIPLPQIQSHMTSTLSTHPDIPGDWVAIGVVYGSAAKPRKSPRGDPYGTLKLTDLTGGCVNVFLFGAAYRAHGQIPEKSVVGILNPKILLPNEKGKVVALTISNPHQWITIGESRDMAFCLGIPANGETCTRVLDRRKNRHCDQHAETLFKQAKLKRQEFLSGDSAFSLSNPRDAARNGKRSRKYDASHGTYLLAGGQALSTGDENDGGLRVLPSCRSGRKMGADEEEDMARMLESGTPGARYLKAARKLTGQGSGDTPWKAAPVAQIFSVEAMSRMGFDPVSGMQFVPVLQKKAKTAAEHAQAACALAVDGNGMVELDFDSD